MGSLHLFFIYNWYLHDSQFSVFNFLNSLQDSSRIFSSTIESNYLKKQDSHSLLAVVVMFLHPPFVVETIGLGFEKCSGQSSFNTIPDINKPFDQTLSNFRDSYFSSSSWCTIFSLYGNCFQTIRIVLFLFDCSVCYFTQLTFL